MKSIIFDTGPIITLAINNLLGILEKLKNSFDGEFFITNAVKHEVIDKPLSSKKYKFEALRVSKVLQNGVFKIFNIDVEEKTNNLLFYANNSFKARGKFIKIVHNGEMEVLAAAIESNANTIVIDERTTRALIENPLSVKERLQRKLHTKVEVNKKNLEKFKDIAKGIKVIRSFELVTIAFEKGFLDGFLIDSQNPKLDLLDGVLWSVKLSGCSVTEDEIKQVLRIEKVV